MYFDEGIQRGIISSERARQRVQSTGRVFGHAVWTPAEDQVVRDCYPDYARACTLLPKRTYWSIRSRAGYLNIQVKRHIWTGAEIKKLKRLYPEATKDELRTAFPGLSITAIERIAAYYGISRNRRRFKDTGHSLLDSVRARAFELRYSMVDLDDIAGTGRYFQDAQWCGRGCLNMRNVCRAVDAMVGTLHVTWDDDGERCATAASTPPPI